MARAGSQPPNRGEDEREDAAQMPRVTENDAGLRPTAGDPHRCHYCKAAIGARHLEKCVSVRRTVRIRVSLELDVEVPRSWDKDAIEFHRNDSSWCANNVLQELEAYIAKLDERDSCLCYDFDGQEIRFQYVGEVNTEVQNVTGDTERLVEEVMDAVEEATGLRPNRVVRGLGVARWSKDACSVGEKHEHWRTEVSCCGDLYASIAVCACGAETLDPIAIGAVVPPRSWADDRWKSLRDGRSFVVLCNECMGKLWRGDAELEVFTVGLFPPQVCEECLGVLVVRDAFGAVPLEVARRKARALELGPMVFGDT